jgi:hypothetical protein
MPGSSSGLRWWGPTAVDTITIPEPPATFCRLVATPRPRLDLPLKQSRSDPVRTPGMGLGWGRSAFAAKTLKEGA